MSTKYFCCPRGQHECDTTALVTQYSNLNLNQHHQKCNDVDPWPPKKIISIKNKVSNGKNFLIMMDKFNNIM